MYVDRRQLIRALGTGAAARTGAARLPGLLPGAAVLGTAAREVAARAADCPALRAHVSWQWHRQDRCTDGDGSRSRPSP